RRLRPGRPRRCVALPMRPVPEQAVLRRQPQPSRLSGRAAGAGPAAEEGVSPYPHPLTPSPTRTHARPGEGEPHDDSALTALGGGAPSPGRGECVWERGSGGEGPTTAAPIFALFLLLFLFLFHTPARAQGPSA